MPEVPTPYADLTASMQRLQHSLLDVSAAMLPALQSFGKSLLHLADVLRAGYERAGRPDGDTENGFQQWCQEVATEARRQEQAGCLWR